MIISEIIKKTKDGFEKVVKHFETDISGIRTGRATPSLVENITVDSYGTKMPLSQLASINVPGTRILTIQPWDRTIIPSIEKAISQSNLGVGCSVDQDLIRISLPPLTEEFRRNFIKILNDKNEEAKVSLRRIREDSWKEMQDRFRSGEIREDDKFKGKDDLQKAIDEYSRKIDELSDRKNKEIMEN